jgi:hypothetical protein
LYCSFSALYTHKDIAINNALQNCLLLYQEESIICKKISLLDFFYKQKIHII